MDVHSTYRPPREFNRFAKDERSGAVRELGDISLLGTQRAIRARKLKLSPADAQRLADLNDGEILASDAKIAELLASLGDRLPRALVFLTSDHGEEFLDPAELHNLSAQDDAVELEQLLETLHLGEPVVLPQPDAKSVESLKALGYTE